MTARESLNLDALDALDARATPGPWRVVLDDTEGPTTVWQACTSPNHPADDPDHNSVYDCCADGGLHGEPFFSEADARFVAAARTTVPRLVAEVRALRVSEAEVVTALGEANDARLRLTAMCRDLTAEVERLRTGAEKVIGDYTRTAEEHGAGGDRDMVDMCQVVVMKVRRDILGGES